MLQKFIPAFLLIASFLIVGLDNAQAQDAKLNLRKFEPRVKKVSFKVYGACDACKKRIESALKIDGIKKAQWDVESKMLHVEYIRNEVITGEYKIQQLVAAAGHDTYKVQASEQVYGALPPCCQYERSAGN